MAVRGRPLHVTGQRTLPSLMQQDELRQPSAAGSALCFCFLQRSRRPLWTSIFDFDPSTAAPGCSSTSTQSSSAFVASFLALYGLFVGTSLSLCDITDLLFNDDDDIDKHPRASPPRGGSGFLTTNFRCPVPTALVRGHL